MLLLQLFLTYLKIGAFTFGGGYAMISLIDHECVEKKKWITAEEFTDMTVIAESTPGPIAINCATFTGYKIAGFVGAMAATLGVVLPSFLILLLISSYFEQLLDFPVVVSAFRGIRVAVAILIMRAAIRMMKGLKKAEKYEQKVSAGIIVLFFLVTFGMNLIGVHLSTIYLILISGVMGYCFYHKVKMDQSLKDMSHVESKKKEKKR